MTLINSTITTRLAEFADLKELQMLFVETIETICQKDYSPEQIKVWVASVENTERWADKLKKQFFLVAQNENKIVGYASLENNNYIDFMYVHKDYQRQGIANRLYAEIEKIAIKRGATILNSDVSITARAYFENKGFQLLSEQLNIIKGVEIVNYKMEKHIL